MYRINGYINVFKQKYYNYNSYFKTMFIEITQPSGQDSQFMSPDVLLIIR